MRKGVYTTAVLVLLTVVQVAESADLERLTRLLVPPLLAQEFASVCQAHDPEFLATDGGLASVSAFSRRVRTMILADLPPSQTEIVLNTALQATQNVVSAEITALTALYREEPGRSYDRWCERSAKPFIHTLMERHKRQGTSIQQDVDRAKQPKPDGQVLPSPY